MIVGNDQLVNLSSWKNYKLIIENVNIICFNRIVKENSFNDSMLKRKINYIKDFKIDISSTEIRTQFLNNNLHTIIDSINPKIIKYIKENNLYV